MDESLRTAIEETKEQLPVTVSLEWYQGTIKLDEVKQYIRANINSASRSFVAIGYYLKYIRDNELYKQEGYSGISEFAKAEFGISPAQASKFMSINDRFSVNSNSPILQERYRDFSSSKLSEMLYLTDEQLEQVTVGTTVAEIRSIKEPKKDSSFSSSKTEPASEIYATSHKEPEQKSFYGLLKSVYPQDSLIATSGCGNKYSCWSCHMANCNIRQEECYCVEAPLGHPYPCTTMNVIDMIKDEVGSKCMFINLDLVEWITDGSNEKIPCCKDCKKKCGYACRKAAEPIINPHENMNGDPIVINGQPVTVRDTPEGDSHPMDVESEAENETNKTFASELNMERISVLNKCIHNQYYMCDLPEELKHVTGPGKECSSEYEEDKTVCCWDCQKHGDCEQECNSSTYRKSDTVETVNADIIQTEPKAEYDFERISAYSLDDVKAAILHHQRDLATFMDCKVNAPIVKRTKMELDAFQALEEGMYMHDMPAHIPPKPQQPELPILKNNDQRKAFIESYETWPIWIDQKETEERYYRYNLDSKTYIVVKVYLHKGWMWGVQKEKESWGYNEYYLVKQGAHFKDCQTNMTALIEFLKDFQKKSVNK